MTHVLTMLLVKDHVVVFLYVNDIFMVRNSNHETM